MHVIPPTAGTAEGSMKMRRAIQVALVFTFGVSLAIVAGCSTPQPTTPATPSSPVTTPSVPSTPSTTSAAPTSPPITPPPAVKTVPKKTTKKAKVVKKATKPAVAKVSKVQVNISNAKPKASTRVMVTVTVWDSAGKPIKGAVVTFVWKFKSGSQRMVISTTSTGVAVGARSVGSTKGAKVIVDVTASSGGAKKSGSTSFTVQ
jgi:hypothetical protein